MMEDDEIRQTMYRQTKPTYHVQLRTGLIDPDELAITGNIQNTSVMIGRDVSALLLLPNELSRHPTTNWGTELIQDETFVRILNDRRELVKSELRPFEKMDISFGRAAKFPEVPPSFSVPLFVRVYDQFGQAHEAEFIVSLHPNSLGHIVSDRQLGRDEGF